MFKIIYKDGGKWSGDKHHYSANLFIDGERTALNIGFGLTKNAAKDDLKRKIFADLKQTQSVLIKQLMYVVKS